MTDGGDVGGQRQVDGSAHQQRAHADHQGGAVEQGQPFLGAQGQRGQPGLSQGFGSAHALAGHVGFPFADEDKGQMGQGGQVSAGAQAALAGDAGVDAGVEQIQQPLHQVRAHAGIAQGQGVGPHHQHGPHDFLGQIWPDAHGVAAHQIELELSGLVRRNDAILEASKARGDAVGHLAPGHQILHCLAGSLHARQGGRIQLHRPALGHSHHLIDGQRLS